MDIVTRTALTFDIDPPQARALLGSLMQVIEAAIRRRSGAGAARRMVESLPELAEWRRCAAELRGDEAESRWLLEIERAMSLSAPAAAVAAAAILGRFGIDGSSGGPLGKAILDYVADTAPPDVVDAVIRALPKFGHVELSKPPTFYRNRPGRYDVARLAGESGAFDTLHEPPVATLRRHVGIR